MKIRVWIKYPYLAKAMVLLKLSNVLTSCAMRFLNAGKRVNGWASICSAKAVALIESGKSRAA